MKRSKPYDLLNGNIFEKVISCLKHNTCNDDVHLDSESGAKTL